MAFPKYSYRVFRGLDMIATFLSKKAAQDWVRDSGERGLSITKVKLRWKSGPGKPKLKNPSRALIPAKVLISPNGKLRVFVSAKAAAKLGGRKRNPKAGPTWDVLYTDNGVTRTYTTSRTSYKQAQTDARQARKVRP